ncbi:lamin tail domain-containing protein 1 isoform X2 [Ascaphus truei]|uniref:lamin tail domain-containing protein 1 isoform X2 n=1 Tax=Ascaphus truei TaxID=8439 RepID=UPI003F5AA9F4
MYDQEIQNLQGKLELDHMDRTKDSPVSHTSSLLATEYQSRVLQLSTELLRRDEEIQALQLLVAQREADIQVSKAAAISPSIQLNLAMQELQGLQRNALMAQKKYEDEFSQRLDLQEKLLELNRYIRNQKESQIKESQEVSERAARSEALVQKLEDRVRRGSRGDPGLMETVQKIQEASEAEVKRLQNETVAVYNQSLLELQMRMNNDQALLGEAQEENLSLHQQVEELTTEGTLLEKKLHSEEANNRAVTEKLEAEHMRGLQHIRGLEARLEEIQDLFLAKMKEVDAFQNKNVSLSNELDSLKSMLEEEGQQMSPAQLLFAPTLPQMDSFQSPVRNLVPEYTKSFLLHPPESLLSATSAGAYRTRDEKTIDKRSQSEQLKRPSSAPIANLHIRTSGQGPGQASLPSLKETSHPKQMKGKPLSAHFAYNTAISSALGNMEIVEVNPSSNFVRLINRSLDKEEDIGGFVLQQNVLGHPVSLYRFPPKIRVMANTTVTVWAAEAKVSHKPPSDFVWKEQDIFVTEPQCTTILCKANGQAVAWYTPMRVRRGNAIEKYEIYATGHTDDTIPSQVPIRNGPRKEEREIHSDAESVGHVLEQPPVPHRQERVKVLLRRERELPPVLPATSSPWTHSTASSTHPHYSLGRSLAMGNDGSSLCRQSRSQSAKTDPTPGALYAGSRRGRNPSASHGSRNSRGPTRSAGARKGTLKLLLPGSFSPICDQHKTGIQILQSVQNLSFQPAMPRPPPLSRHGDLGPSDSLILEESCIWAILLLLVPHCRSSLPNLRTISDWRAKFLLLLLSCPTSNLNISSP